MKKESWWCNPVQVWRCKNQGSQWFISQSKAKSLRMEMQGRQGKGSCRCRSLSLKARKAGAPVFKARKRWTFQLKREFALPLPFCSIQPLNRLDDAYTYQWRWNSVHWMSANLFWKYSQTCPGIMLYQQSGHPLVQPNAHKINHHHVIIDDFKVITVFIIISLWPKNCTALPFSS